MKPTPYTAKVAVPLPSDEEARAEIGSSYQPDTTLNVAKMLAGTGDMFPALAGMVQAVFGAEDIGAKRREVIILRASATLNVPYEWQANEQMARNAGLSAREIEAVAADGPVTSLDDEYNLLCAATDQMLTAGTLADDTLSALLERFGDTVTRRYIATISWFSLLSLFLNSTRVPLEVTDKIGDRTSPLGMLPPWCMVRAYRGTGWAELSLDPLPEGRHQMTTDPHPSQTPAQPPSQRPPGDAAPGHARVPLPHHKVRRTRISGLWVAVACFAVALLLLLIFILQNSHTVEVSYFGAHGHLPLGVALLLAAVAGVLLIVAPGAARIIQLRRTAHRHRNADTAHVTSAQSATPAGPGG